MYAEEDAPFTFESQRRILLQRLAQIAARDGIIHDEGFFQEFQILCSAKQARISVQITKVRKTWHLQTIAFRATRHQNTLGI